MWTQPVTRFRANRGYGNATTLLGTCQILVVADHIVRLDCGFWQVLFEYTAVEGDGQEIDADG